MSSLNIYQKLDTVRRSLEIDNLNILYPEAQELFQGCFEPLKLMPLFSINKDSAKLKVINLENPQVYIEIESPVTGDLDVARLSLYKLLFNFPEHPVIRSEVKSRRISATNFSAILGKSEYKSPYKAWFEIVKPESLKSKSTLAGDIIEPIMLGYARKVLGINFKSREDVYGKDYLKVTNGNFFSDSPYFSGMWDAIDDYSILEIKTTSIKYKEMWEECLPIEYQLQGALYAYLSHKPNIYFACAFLTDNDKANPEKFIPTENNTLFKNFSLSDNFEEAYVIPAIDFYKKYIETGISPY